MTSLFEPTRLKWLERDGVALAYHYMPGNDPAQAPLVFVHGWAGSAEDWKPLVESYRERGYGVLVYDAAGFGQSRFKDKEAAKQADFSLGRYVEDLKALLDAEKIERVRLIGHSWGGVVTMCFAARYPERVEALAPIGSAYFDPENLLHQILKWVSYLIAQILVLMKPWLRRSPRLRKLAVRRYFHRPPDEARTELLMEDVLESDNRAIVQTLLTGYDVRFKKICPAIRCPTLYVGSDHDVVAPLPYVLAFVPLTPGATSFTLKNCGHFPMLEQPAHLLDALDNFLK